MSEQYRVVPNFDWAYIQGDILPESLGSLNSPLGRLNIFPEDEGVGESSEHVDNIGTLLSQPDSFFKQTAEVLSSDIEDDVRLVPSEKEANIRVRNDDDDDYVHDTTVGDIRENCREWLADENFAAITKPGWIDEFLSEARTKLETWVMTAKRARNFAAECLKKEIPHPEAVIKTTTA